MKTVLKALNIFFVTLGIIFLLLLIFLAYFFVADPLNLKGLFISTGSQNANNDASSDKHPLLSAEQEKTLESLGINPAQLPTEITPEMEACFITKLGAERVKEIEQGAEPGPTDILKASPCLKQ